MINDNPNLLNFITREQEDKWKQKGPKKKKTEAGAKSKQ
jgi:hypothetical protein